MSDRCYMTIQCSKKDYDEVLHEYFTEVLEEDGGYVEAADSEANYAYTNETEEWVKQGLIFTAFHDVGATTVPTKSPATAKSCAKLRIIAARVRRKCLVQ